MRSALPGSAGNIYLVRASDGHERPMFETLLTKAQFTAAPDASLLVYDDYDYNSQNHVLKVMEPDGANCDMANFTGVYIHCLVARQQTGRFQLLQQFCRRHTQRGSLCCQP
jgi:hypothetical protein